MVVVSALVLGVLFSAPMVISVSLMPVSMALAGPVADLIGLTTTFVIAGVAPGVFAIAAIVLWRLPADEVENPLS